MKRSLGLSNWIRRGLGAAVLLAVVAMAAGMDTGLLTRISLAGTASLEQGLLDKLQPAPPSVVMSGDEGGPGMMMAAGGAPAMMMMKAAPGGPTEFPVEGDLPSLAGAVTWLNSPPLTAEALKGKVVLIDFWTYSCINCLRAIPYVRAWAEKYKDQGLVVIGVHAPEFAFEKNVDNVRRAVADLKIGYPVAIDNDYAIWRAFNNQYWPAHFFIDAKGKIRHHHFGEGDYEGSERVIQQLLAEAGNADITKDLVSVHATGAEAAPDMSEVQSPETYIGYKRAENFISPGGEVPDSQHLYSSGPAPLRNQWGLSGQWTVGPEDASLNEKDGSIFFRFQARDLHLVLGPAADGKPVRFRVTLDGAAPGAAHGSDVAADGTGVVSGQRLYQLIRQDGAVGEHRFEIFFLDPGVQAYAFTFG